MISHPKKVRVKGGEGLAAPFTRINVWLLQVYVWLVKDVFESSFLAYTELL